ncbi:MAG: diheme cytochrome c [Gammaproteobacteria bacterium]|nr:diheme cytochrome c [Gammaproteobacteria bacterium]
MNKEWSDMKLRWLAAAMAAAVVGLSGTLAFSDSDREGREKGERGWLAGLAAPTGVKPVDNPLYAAECSSCHFAYQPGLLPEASWRELMANLSDHFGENAELTPETQKLLTDYLIQNAAEQDGGWLARDVLRDADKRTEPVIRITETAFFIHEHDELPQRVWRDNPKVGSMSNCSACHTKADNASFDEHQVSIPGVGRWED